MCNPVNAAKQAHGDSDRSESVDYRRSASFRAAPLLDAQFTVVRIRLATRDAARVDSSEPFAGFRACPFPPDFSHS
jgi:hypothetical protein